MTLFAAWFVLPALLGLLALGCGLLLELLSGTTLPRPVLLPAGFAVVVVVSSLATAWSSTAQFATPAVLALALMGLGFSFPWRRIAEPWALVAAGATFVAYAVPVVASGRATFAGYIKLDDTSTWLAITDRAIEHGRSLAGLAPSTYEATLSQYVGQTGYPIGSVVPLGVAHQLMGVDSAWLFQPYLAFQAAMLALVLYTIVSRLIDSSWLRALISFIAAQSTLLYGYALWGSVKELVAVVFVALLAVLVPRLLRDARPSPRPLAPLAVVCVAMLAALNVGGAVWVALAVLPALALVRRLSRRAFVIQAAAFTALMLALSIPTLQTLRAFYGPASVTLSKASEFGNLVSPLSPLQLFGIWPVGDFRLRPEDMTRTYVLIALAVIAAVIGIIAAWRTGAWELPLYVVISVVGFAILARIGSPWVDAKALATASPAPLLAAMAGAAVLVERGRRVEGAVLAAVIAGGVLWSNALAYHEVWLAPSTRLGELETIGKRFTGEGPTLMTDFDVYGVKHFLRDMDPESTSTLGRRPMVLVDGTVPAKGTHVDVDELMFDTLPAYRTLVLRRSPVASRPPSNYDLLSTGRYYEVWQQRPGAPQVTSHVPLGSAFQAAAIPQCSEILRLASLAESQGARLATVPRPQALVLPLGESGARLPYGEDRAAVRYLRAPYTSTASIELPTRGRYGIWIGGSFRSRLEIRVDGRLVGSNRDQLNWPNNFVLMGDEPLDPGTHTVTLLYQGPDVFHPGSAGEPPFGTGPLVIAEGTADRPVEYIQPSDAPTLCGRNLDWIEVVKP